MIPVREILLDDASEVAVPQQLARETVEHRAPSRDRGSEEDATCAQHASRLGERGVTILRPRQVVERSKEQHHIRGAVWLGKRARVCHFALYQTSTRVLVPRARYVDEARRRIEEADLVSPLSEPEGVGPGRPTDIQHDCRSRRRVPEYQLTAPRFLERRPQLQARFFRRSVVVRLDRGIVLRRNLLDYGTTLWGPGRLLALLSRTGRNSEVAR
jgi:hypothetical protein